MRYSSVAFACLVLAGLLTACSRRPVVPAALPAVDVEEFKAALIAYIDTHPGYFIGRRTSEGLRDKPLVRLEPPEPEPQYALGEFIIEPGRMRFQANYGVQGPEPYLYVGKFTRSSDGSLHVGEVNLTRFHALRKRDGRTDGSRPSR